MDDFTARKELEKYRKKYAGGTDSEGEKVPELKRIPSKELAKQIIKWMKLNFEIKVQWVLTHRPSLVTWPQPQAQTALVSFSLSIGLVNPLFKLFLVEIKHQFNPKPHYNSSYLNGNLNMTLRYKNRATPMIETKPE